MLVVFAKRLKTNLHPSIALHICTYSKLSVIIVPKSNRYAIKNLYQYYQNGLNILHQPIVFLCIPHLIHLQPFSQFLH